jgi:hypothetical protein
MSSRETPRQKILMIVLEKLFQCLTCSKYFVGQEKFQSHQENDHIEEKFQSHQENDQLKEKIDLVPKVEVSVVEAEQPKKETIVDRNKGKLTKLKPKTIPIPICSICNTVCLSKLELMKHIKKTHGCKVSEQTFDNAPAWKIHMKMGHQKVGCEKCNKLFRTKGWLISHIKKFHPQENTENIECEVCKQTFNEKPNLKSHLKNDHHRIQCEICGKLFITQACFLLHNKTIHQEDKTEIFECKLCQQKFNEKLALQSHMKNDHQINRFHQPEKAVLKRVRRGKAVKCSHCDQIFSTKTLLDQHISIEKLAIVPCTMCDKRYTDKFSLRRHILYVHNKEKRERVCNICKKRFVDECQLKRHSRHVHEKIKTVECKLCLKKFPQLQNLEKHVQNVHLKLKPFTCEICGNVFAQSSSLGLHQKNIHKIDKRSNNNPKIVNV